MAETENLQLCLEKRDIQRSSDGLPLCTSQWEVKMLYQNKSQYNGAKQVGKYRSKKSSKKRVENDYLQEDNSISKCSEKYRSLSKLQHTVDESALPSSFLAEGAPSVQSTANRQGGEDTRRGNSGVYKRTGRQAERFGSSQAYIERNKPIVKEHHANAECVRNENIQECRTDVSQESRLLAETRITSLRKLLNSPLKIETSNSLSPESGSGDVGRAISHSEFSGYRRDNHFSSSEKVQLSPSHHLHTATKTRIDEENTMSAGILSNHKNNRKRSAKSVENFSNMCCHDEVKEKIAELARTPRIKSLEEILASLHIRLDNKLCDEGKNINSTQGSENCTVSESPIAGKRGKTLPDNDSTRSSSKLKFNSLYSHSKLNDNRNETQKQQTCSSEERPTNSSKRVKVIFSGEVSRKHKPINPMKTSSENIPSCAELSNVGIQKYANPRNQINAHEDIGGKIRDWKTLKKKRRVLARKRHVNNTKELKAILQARTSYRKEIPTILHDISQSSTLEIPCKNPRRDSDVSPSELQVSQWNCFNSFESSSLETCPDTYVPSNGMPDDASGVSSRLLDEPSENKVNENPNRILHSPTDSIDDELGSEDREVKNILSQLPPLRETEIDWTASQVTEFKTKSPEDIECLVSKMGAEHIEGVNGNHNGGPVSNAFREWHETVTRPSYAERSLILLPYVIID